MTADTNKNAETPPSSADGALGGTSTPEEVSEAQTGVPTADGRRRRDPSSEAAARRHEVRDLEGQLAAERTARADDRAAYDLQLLEMRRDAIENVITHDPHRLTPGPDGITLHRAEDLWDILAAEPGQFYDDDGRLDHAALGEFIATATEGRTYLRRSLPPLGHPPIDAVKSAMERAGAIPVSAPGATAWAGALKR